jgi:hypothetical protein
MKKIAFTVFILLLSVAAKAQEEKQLELENFIDLQASYRQTNEEDMGGANVLGAYLQNWPKDYDGENFTALLRVRFINLPMQEAEKVVFRFPGTVRQKYEFRKDINECWIFIDAVDDCTIEANHPAYGTSNLLRIPMEIKMKPKGSYMVTLKNNKTVNIHITSQPEGAVVTFDGIVQEKKTPFDIAGVRLGKHELKWAINGKTKTETVEVAEGNTSFNSDLREYRTFTIESDPKGATIYIDKERRGIAPMEVRLPFGPHEFRAELSATEVDVQAITIDTSTGSVLQLHPIKKKEVEFFAKYAGQRVNAELYVDGKSEEITPRKMTLNYGRHNIRMSYLGQDKKQAINVNNNSASAYELKIPTRNNFTWPWEIEYLARPFGVSMGYVSKEWVSTGDGFKVGENVWGDVNKKLHGMQWGWLIEPSFSWGGGLHTGLFWEYYSSTNDEWGAQGYLDHFEEHCLYIPIQLSFRIPFSETVALFVHGGVGMDYGLIAEFSSTDTEDNSTSKDYYGEEMWPGRFNLSAEIGASFSFRAIQLNVQYSKGLTDHGFYSDQGDIKTHQNKFSISLAYMIRTKY